MTELLTATASRVTATNSFDVADVGTMADMPRADVQALLRTVLAI